MVVTLEPPGLTTEAELKLTREWAAVVSRLPETAALTDGPSGRVLRVALQRFENAPSRTAEK